MQAEKEQARKVVGASGMSVSRPLFFGTRRTTHSDVISVITTIVPQGRDLGVTGRAPLPQTGSIEEASAELNKSKKKPQPFTNAEYLSPLYDPVLSSTDEHARRNKALWKEHATFMRSLRQQRQARAKAEFAGASALQRLWRGYLLRRWLKKNRSKMKIRRKMKKSYAKIALKVRLQRRLEEESRRAEQRKEDAADKIAATFRMYLALNCARKERKLRLDEVRRWAVIMVEQIVRVRLAQRAVMKKRRAKEEAFRLSAVRRIQSSFRALRARRLVTAVRIRLERVAAIMIQRAFRRSTARAALLLLKKRSDSSKMHASAAVVQQAWRGVLGRRAAYVRKHAEDAEMLEASALAVQCAIRGAFGRRLVKRMRQRRVAERRIAASIRMQKFGRSILGKKRFADEQGRQDEDVWTQVRRGNVAAVEDLRALGFILDADATEDSSGHTILTLAAKHGHKRLVRRALKWGGDIDHVDDDGLSAVELAVLHGFEGVAEYLVEKEADVTFFGRTLVHEAAQRGMLNCLVALMQRGVPVGTEDVDGKTPLHEATSPSGSVEVTRALIDRGAPLDSKDHAGRTALHNAAEKGDPQLCQLLVDAGARLDIKDADGRTPWRTALAHNMQDAARVLRAATSRGGKKAEALLASKSIPEGELLNAFAAARVGKWYDEALPVELVSEGGTTLLMAAASSGNAQLVEKLVRRGADVEALDDEARNSLHYCPNSFEVGKVLASRGCDLHHDDAYGITPMHLFAQSLL